MQPDDALRPVVRGQWQSFRERASQGSPLQRFNYVGRIFHSTVIISTFLELLLVGRRDLKWQRTFALYRCASWDYE